MEKQKMALLWLVQLLLLRCCLADGGPSPLLSSRHLSCYNDYNHTMDCVWSSSDADLSSCSVFANYSHPEFSSYWASCQLKSFTETKQNCSLVFKFDYTFSYSDKLVISVSCGQHTYLTVDSYSPESHIKVHVKKPVVNISTVSWTLAHEMLDTWSYELQWKHLIQPWSEALEIKQDHQKNQEFTEELEQDWLIRGETYEARVRMKVSMEGYDGVWSDWSPALAWVSPVGGARQLTGHDGGNAGYDSNRPFAVRVWQMIVIGVVGVVLVLIVVFHRTNKTLWVHLGKKVQGELVPNPAKSFLQQDWLNSPFTAESFHAFLRPEIASVEVMSPLESVDEPMHDKRFNYCNPSYSSCFPPRPVAGGTLDPCPSDCSYGPVSRRQREETEPTQTLELDLNDRKPTGMLELEKLWRSKFKLPRLQSLDSGVGVSEDVSQENIAVHDAPNLAPPVHVYYDYECVERSPTFPEQPLMEHPVIERSLMERFTLMSSGSVEPSGDDYMPVKQQH